MNYLIKSLLEGATYSSYLQKQILNNKVVHTTPIIGTEEIPTAKAATGLSEEMGDVNLAVERANDKVLSMQARAQAMDQLLEQGALQEVGQLGTGGDMLDRQLGQIADQAQIEAQLATIKQQMQLDPGRPPQTQPQLA